MNPITTANTLTVSVQDGQNPRPFREVVKDVLAFAANPVTAPTKTADLLGAGIATGTAKVGEGVKAVGEGIKKVTTGIGGGLKLAVFVLVLGFALFYLAPILPALIARRGK